MDSMKYCENHVNRMWQKAQYQKLRNNWNIVKNEKFFIGKK